MSNGTRYTARDIEQIEILLAAAIITQHSQPNVWFWRDVVDDLLAGIETGRVSARLRPDAQRLIRGFQRLIARALFAQLPPEQSAR